MPFRPADDETSQPPLADGGDDGDTDDGDNDVVVLSWWQHPVNVVALVVAVALIGGMVGWLIRDTSADRGNAADVGFLHDMRAHHEQAAQMSLLFLGLDDTSPGLRTVAGSILVGQNLEIGRMIQMLRDMGQPEAAETDEAMAWMGMATTQAEMPGMATEAELRRLAASSGASADQLFVELMVTHHEAGIDMADAAGEDAGLAKVRSMARSIVAGQREEIAELRLLVDP